MPEQRKPSPVIGGIAAFLAVLLGGAIYVKTRDSAPNTQHSTPPPMVSSSPEPGVPAEESGGDEPGDSPVSGPQEPPAEPIDTRPMVDLDPKLSTASSNLEIITSPTGRRRAVIPTNCDGKSIEKALTFAQSEGYEYLARRCDLMYRWLHDGHTSDIVVWLCEKGYSSPAAEQVGEVTQEMDYGFFPKPTLAEWDSATVTHEEGQRAVMKSKAWLPCAGDSLP